jgi:hypothetical protein
VGCLCSQPCTHQMLLHPGRRQAAAVPPAQQLPTRPFPPHAHNLRRACECRPAMLSLHRDIQKSTTQAQGQGPSPAGSTSVAEAEREGEFSPPGGSKPTNLTLLLQCTWVRDPHTIRQQTHPRCGPLPQLLPSRPQQLLPSRGTPQPLASAASLGHSTLQTPASAAALQLLRVLLPDRPGQMLSPADQ